MSILDENSYVVHRSSNDLAGKEAVRLGGSIIHGIDESSGNYPACMRVRVHEGGFRVFYDAYGTGTLDFLVP